MIILLGGDEGSKMIANHSDLNCQGKNFSRMFVSYCCVFRDFTQDLVCLLNIQEGSSLAESTHSEN